MKKILIAVIIVISTFISSCSKPQESDKALFDKGLATLDRGQITEARAIFATLDTLSPVSPYGPYGQALCFQKEEFVFEAIEAYEKILEKHSDFAPALMSYAELAIRTGRDKLSIGLSERYVKTVGETGKSLSLKIEALLTAGEMEKAGQAVDVALSKLPDEPLILLSSAKYYFHAGDLSKSEELIGRALGKIGDNSEALISAAGYYSQRGLADSAANLIKNALDRSKDDFYLKGRAAEILIGLRYYFASGQLLKEMSKNSESSHLYYCLMAETYEKQGNMKKARKAYEPAMVRFPKYITVMRNMGLYKFKSFEAMSSEAYLTTAFTMASDKNYPEDELTNLALDHIEGLLYQNKGDKTTAMVASLVDSIPNDFRVLSDAAGIYLIFAPREKATKVLKDLARLSAGNSARLARVGKIYEKADSLQTAENYYSEALKLDKRSVPAILGMTSILRGQNNPQQGIQFISSLGGDALEIPEVAGEMISLYQSTGDPTKALNLASEQIALGSQDLDRYKTALTLAVSVKDAQIAESLVKDCLGKNPDNPYAYSLIGQYYFENGNSAEARKAADKALALDDNFIDAHLLTAELDTLQGDIDKASAVYEKVLTLDKECGPAHAGLAWLITEKGGNYQVAANHAMSALSSDPEKPMYYVALGWSYYKAGRYNIARGNFEKALRFAPDDAVVNYYAGLGYWKDGKPEKAKECLQKALANGLSGKLRPEAEATLKNL